MVKHLGNGSRSSANETSMCLLLCVWLAVVIIGVSAEGPCDITAKAGNPCVAAHSTVRALYSAYDGPLYKVTRNSDGESTNIGVLKAGGFANIAKHESFCTKLDCVISNVFDQSPQGNHLRPRHKVSVGYRGMPTPAPTPAPHCVEVGQSTCYEDSIKNRIMGNYILRSEGITREQCMQLCNSRQNKLAGVENGNQCMCGDSVNAPVPSVACTMKCGGNNSELCGGYDVIDIMHFTCA
jgi:hypothetical protein